jgi:CubicO group peptidase (beta-lactamase class C family)
MRALVISSVLVLLGSGVSAAQDRPVVSGEAGRQMDEYLTRLAAFGFSGGALAVRGRDVLLLKAYGLADRAHRIVLATDSVFNLGSITKQFTAAAILTLETQKKLAVGDPISRYFEGVPPDKAAITIHHLLTHSSGLRSDFSPSDYDPVGREEYVRRALDSKLLFPPGKGYEYANAGYSLLAAIVERVSGQPYEAYLIEHVLKPAGMRETGYKAPGWAKERVARGYRDGEEWGTIVDRIQQPDAPYWTLRGNGGLHTTLADMLAWHRSLDTNAVLSKEERAKYFTPYVAEGPRGLSHYAYGWAVSRTRRGTTVVQHNGGNGIFVAEFLRFPDEDAMLFVTSTDAGLKATPVVEALERVLFAEPVRLPPTIRSVPAERVAARGGRWVFPNGGVVVVAANGSGLTLKAEDAAAFSALNQPPAAVKERYAQVTARTADITARAFRGDVSGLREAMGGDMPVEEMRAQESSMMREREARLGAFVRSSVLGTMAREEDTVQAVVRLDFEKGTVYNVYVWGPRRLLGIRGMPELPALRYLPVSEREFAAYSFEGGGSERRISFEGEGGAATLTVLTPGGPVVAGRAR